MSEPLVLPRNCANCAHYDGEGWCALPARMSRTISRFFVANRPIPGYIGAPSMVVCAQHEQREPEPVEGAAV